MIEAATEVIEFVKSKGLEIRFSCEDSFRSDRTDLLRVCFFVRECARECLPVCVYLSMWCKLPHYRLSVCRCDFGGCGKRADRPTVWIWALT